MKYYTFIIACGLSASMHAQSFVNGSFENNSCTQKCGYNLVNSDINAQVKATTAFGSYEAIDILKAGCIIESIADGNVAIGIANNPSDPQNGEAISLELSESLKEGEEYEVTFKVHAITKYGPQGDLIIGTSASADAFGDEVYSAKTSANEWITITLKFKAAKDVKFITVKPVSGVKSWNVVDDFTIKSL